MGKLDGRVAFITGAARGQGRSHAIRFAQEGADVIAVDLCEQIESVPYRLSTPEDLEETVRAVEALDRRIVPIRADVRELTAMQQAVRDGVAQLGRLDIVLANAGISPKGDDETAAQAFGDVIAVNLVGVWNTLRAAAPVLVEQGDGGSIVITSSTVGLKGVGTDSPGLQGYTASKTAVVGLMKVYANLLGQHSIRVNTVHPAGVNTPMIINEFTQKWLADRSDDGAGLGSMTNLLPVGIVEPEDVTNAILWLVSDEGRYVTGVTLAVDAGYSVK